MAKITLDDILPISRYKEIADSAQKMAELTEEKFSLLISFLEENKESLLQKIDITKYLDDTFKIKTGKEEDYHKKFIEGDYKGMSELEERREREYFVDEGIFLGNYIIGMPRENKSFFGHKSSWFRKEKEIFYLPSVTFRDFLEVTKNYSTLDRGFAGCLHVTETIGYKKINKEDAIKGVNLLKLTKMLTEFLSIDKNERKDFSRFYISSWFREFERKRKPQG